MACGLLFLVCGLTTSPLWSLLLLGSRPYNERVYNEVVLAVMHWPALSQFNSEFCSHFPRVGYCLGPHFEAYLLHTLISSFLAPMLSPDLTGIEFPGQNIWLQLFIFS